MKKTQKRGKGPRFQQQSKKSFGKKHKTLIVIVTLLVVIFVGWLIVPAKEVPVSPSSAQVDPIAFFQEAVGSLPDANIREYLTRLIAEKKILVEVINAPNQPFAGVKQVLPEPMPILRINSHYFDSGINNAFLWCILVHEQMHIQQALERGNGFTQSKWDARLAWEDEFESAMAEMQFAQNYGLLEKVHPDVFARLADPRVSFEQATAMWTLDNMMTAPLYSPIRGELVKIFNEEVAPLYMAFSKNPLR